MIAIIKMIYYKLIIIYKILFNMDINTSNKLYFLFNVKIFNIKFVINNNNYQYIIIFSKL